MSVSPVANRSFLHGDRKAFPISERIIYATLDSLALKRATLPLQLLPVHDNNITTEETLKDIDADVDVDANADTRRSSSKIEVATSLSSRQHLKYLLFVPSSKTAELREKDRWKSGKKDLSSEVEQRDRRNAVVDVAYLQPVTTDSNDIDITLIRVGTKAKDKESPLIGETVENRRDFDNSHSTDDDIARSSSSKSEKESPPDDYERIESVGDRTAWCNVPKETKRKEYGTSLENVEESLYSKDAFVKSRSCSDTRLADRDEGYLIETFSEEKLPGRLLFANENSSCGGKKKKHFAKNVLNFVVPEYLVKGPKRRQKKKCNLSVSLSSLKASSIDSTVSGTRVDCNSSCRSRSLSREEFKFLKISSPTNFVHVASATNPSLVLNENTIRLNLEQVVITHEEKCATLPLLVAATKNSGMVGNQMGESSISETERVSLFNVPSSGADKSGKEEAARKSGGSFDFASVKRELLSKFDIPSSVKTLESRQQVKTNKYRGNIVREGKTTYMSAERESTVVSLPVELCNNSSFLWSNRSNNYSENTGYEVMRSTLNHEEPEDVDAAEEYDDVGPLNLIVQEDNYDDVGIPVSHADGSRIGHLTPAFEDSDSIYDDVMVPCNMENIENLFTRNQREMYEDESKEEDGSYLSDTNQYSSVDENTDDTLDQDQDVYDDVGLPSQERVNSLYAGSTTGSILGSTSINGKESEWEDLEESPTIALPYPVNTDAKFDLSIIETQVASSKKRLSGQKWSRKMKRQRTRVSRKSFKSSSSKLFQDDTSNDTTYESLRSFQPDDFSSDSETEQKIPNQSTVTMNLEAPTKPNPPPPRELSLTRTLGKRIKMFRRTWTITKGNLGRMRRSSSVHSEHSYEKNKYLSNDHSNLDGGKYFNLARHFRKSISGPLSTFYLNGYTTHDTTPHESSTGTCHEEADHYSVLADQEPLYQFYAAAAARVAYDSNSDGYDEVEDMIPSRCTTDLAKPGHKTLWCQTPQVINNGLLQRLNTEEKKIQEAKFEILTSEASYLNSLRVLKNEFLDEHLINEILPACEKDKLFGDIPSVLQASEQFLAELETVWRQDPMLHALPDVLLKYADKSLDIYVAYCSNQVSTDTTLKDLQTRRGLKFTEAVSQIEARPTCQSLSLHSFLMLPMQRITRLPLLVDAVLSKLPIEHADKSQWELVLSRFSHIVAACNEGARAAAKEIEMENLARKLEYSVKIKPILLRGKHLVKSGPVVQLSTKTDTEYKRTFGRKFNKTPLYLLLLTDYLLVAKYKSNTHNETYTVIDTCKRSLIALESVPEDSPFAGRNAMLLTLLENYSGHQVEYILTCESDTERQRWLEAVSPSERTLIEETLYEVWDCPQVVALYCYSPNQPDELSLYPGDVINVFRKMSDGWYHGEKLLNSEQGWFPGNYAKEVASEHVRARNLKQRHRFLAVSGNVLQNKKNRPTISQSLNKLSKIQL
ncbi:NGEF [Anthophora quadrimaculata]